MSVTYEPASEPLHISVKYLFSHREFVPGNECHEDVIELQVYLDYEKLSPL